ncbi:hypothetical protein M3J09_006985 [Ascochyta lentis]
MAVDLGAATWSLRSYWSSHPIVCKMHRKCTRVRIQVRRNLA